MSSDGEIRNKNSFFNRFRSKRSGTEDSSVQTGSGKSRGSYSSRKSKTKSSTPGYRVQTIAEDNEPAMNRVVTPDKFDSRDHSGRTSPYEEPRDPSGDRVYSSHRKGSNAVDPHGEYDNSRRNKKNVTPDQKKHCRAPPRPAGNREPHEYIAPPPAREAAFAGPPRFDWIDVVSLSFNFVAIVEAVLRYKANVIVGGQRHQIQSESCKRELDGARWPASFIVPVYRK